MFIYYAIIMTDILCEFIWFIEHRTAPSDSQPSDQVKQLWSRVLMKAAIINTRHFHLAALSSKANTHFIASLWGEG